MPSEEETKDEIEPRTSPGQPCPIIRRNRTLALLINEAQPVVYVPGRVVNRMSGAFAAYAAATTQAILDVVTSVRSAAPLAR